MGSRAKKNADKIDWLNSYKERVTALQDYEEKIEELRNAGLSSQPITGMPLGNGKKDVTDRYCKIITLEEKYQELRQDAFQTALDILEAIEGLENERHRMLLRKKYIKDESWNKVAGDMDIEKQSAFRMQGRALEELQMPDRYKTTE